MELFADVCGFVGAWLLVSGPLYQASLELREEDLEIERIHAASKLIQPPKKVSAWWWLVPPVKLLIQRQRSQAYRREYLKVLQPEDIEALISFINKATGWLMVAAGATLIAVKETLGLVDKLDAPHYLFWIALPCLLFLSVSYTVLRTVRAKRIATKYR